MFIMVLSSLTTKAMEYITDVMLIGASTESELHSLKSKYSSQGWKIIEYDLNKGIPWGKGDAILLLYKSEESTDGYNHNYITDFYLQNRSAANTTNTLNYNGRTYNLVPYDGSSHFREQKGDLNSGTGSSSDAIHLYYTRQEFPDRRAVTNIIINGESSGALGKEGGSGGYDLNKGCGSSSAYVYMHFNTHPTLEPDYFITDVKVLGARSKNDIDGLKNKYKNEGWTIIDYDLNKGVSSNIAPWVYLIYKKEHRNKATNGFITDFYFDSARPKISIKLNGIDYYPASYDGDEEFMTRSDFQGNLNAGIANRMGGKNIHLLYTKEIFLPDNCAINDIYVDNDPKGAFLDYDLNLKDEYSNVDIASAEPSYMHVTKGPLWRHLTPVSNLEGCELNDRNIHVWGWTYDPDEATKSNSVRVELIRPDGTVYKTENVNTDKQRDDVNSSKDIIGNHGFDATISVEKGGTYIVKVYACDLTGDNDVQLGEAKTFKVKGSKPLSNLDIIETTETGIRVKGWAYDPDYEAQPVPLRVEVKRINGSAYKTMNVTANLPYNGNNGNHGFDTTIPIENADTYVISIFAGDLTDDGETQVGSTATKTFIGNSPISYLDAYTAQEKGFRIRGWAYDPDSPTESIPVRVEVKRTDGTTYKTETVSANILRSDVNNAKGITGNHGFDATVSVPKAGNYTIELYACDLTKNADSQIGSTKTLRIVGSKPVSSLEVCEESNGGIRIKGWAYDPDEPGEKLPIRVVIKYANDAEYTTKDMTTDDVREDINNAKGISGCHGFSTSIPVSAGTYKVSVFAYDLTEDGDVQVGTTTTLTFNGTVWVNEESEEVTLMDGNIVTGTGGDNTRLVIVAGATVTLSGINITSPMSTGNKIYENDEDYFNNTDRLWSGITCMGDATIILADGTSNYIQGGGIRYSGIQPGPPGTTLTIRGKGELEARGWPHGAGIGSANDSKCGNIVIEGGTIKAYSFSVRYRMFNGSPITVTSEGFGAAIGTGASGTCGDIVITGGEIYAETGKGTAAIGCGSPGNCGNIKIGNSGLRINAKVYTGENYYTIGIAPGNQYADSSCGALTIGGVQTDYITENPWSYAPVDNNYTYTVSYKANGGDGSMDNQVFVYNKPQALNACTLTQTGYHFTGWNTKPDGSGVSYTDQQEINVLTSRNEVITLYAQWELDKYSIAYVDAVNGTDNIINTNPTSYTYINPTINLTAPTKFGYNFMGWTWEGQATPTMSASITNGSLGKKTFTAHWTGVNDLELTPDVRSFTMQDGQTIMGTGGTNTHITIADGATVTLNGVNITDLKDDNTAWWAGITCLGSATIILADGSTNYLKGGYTQRPGVFVGRGYTLTIKGNGTLHATGSGSGGPGIGGNYEIANGNIIIEGGTIMAMGSSYAPGIGNRVVAYASGNPNGGDITIKGGTITAIGGFRAAAIGSGEQSRCGKITITDGVTKVTATKNDVSEIIGAGNKGSCGTVSIAKELIDVAGRNTRTLWGYALTDNSDNTDAISTRNGRTTDVQLKGRTLYKNGEWNTICIPFNATLANGPLAGADVRALDNANLTDGVLTLNFTGENAIDELVAGTPYIIKWANNGDANIVDPVFTDVTIDNTDRSFSCTDLEFKGTYSYHSFDNTDKSIIFLGTGNTLYYPLEGAHIGACRAFFDLNAPSNSVKSFRMNFGDNDSEDGIESVNGNGNGNNAVYNLSGQKLGKPQKGVNIVNGKKVLVK